MKKDVNYKSFVQEKDLVVDSWTNPDVPSEFDDVMKFSNCENVRVQGVTIKGGNEDCIDAVRGKNYLFENLTLIPHRNGVTLKGSIDGWHLKNILFSKEGKEYTIEIGQYDNYWTPSTPPTRNGVIENVKMEDGGKVVVRVWDGEPITLINASNVKIIKIPKFIWFPYFCFRSWQRDKNFFKNFLDKIKKKN